MANEEQLGKIRWRCCRRGMLELDLLLTKFFDQHYTNLSEKEKKLFQQLLEYGDQKLFSWLLGCEQPDNPEILLLTTKIRGVQRKND